MHWAVDSESAAVLRLLLTVDATYFRNAFRQTVLHRVAQCGGVEACDAVLRLRSDAHADTDVYETCFFSSLLWK